ncbi:MAG: hypothetical protein U0746_03015 [Gemmataceae bacterium]
MRKPKQPTSAATLPPSIRSDLEHVVDHYIDDEAEAFDATPDDEKDGHVYISILNLREWLDGKQEGEKTQTDAKNHGRRRRP